MKRFLVVWLGVVTMGTAWARNAEAAPITWQFDAEIIFITPGFVTPWSLGQASRLTLTFDPATGDSNPSLPIGSYVDAIVAAAVAFVGQTYTWDAGTATTNEIEIFDNDQPGLFDTISVQLLGGWSGPLSPSALHVDLLGSSNTLSTSALPTVPPDPADFAINALLAMGFGGTPTAPDAIVQSRITSITDVTQPTPAPVPEPATMLLTAGGLAAGLLRRARRNRRQ